MKRLLVAAACVWPCLLALAVWARVGGRWPEAADGVYLLASRICHQRPDRSFSFAGVYWPVCGRCAGLYLAAPAGAVLAWIARGPRPDRLLAQAVVAGAIPTAVTFVAEWVAHQPLGNVTRAVAAVPLGAVLAYTLVAVAPGTMRPIR